jgi:hypothetical protein
MNSSLLLDQVKTNAPQHPPQTQTSGADTGDEESMTQRKLVTMLSAILLLAGTAAKSFSQSTEHEDYDAYKLRLDAFWFYASPSGYIQGSTNMGVNGDTIDLKKDLGLPDFSTFIGKADWKFTRKNHLYFAAIPLSKSHQTTLTRTFTFQGQTFTAGLTAGSSLNTVFLAPGYQYDIIRRKRGHLGIAVQLDLLNTKGTISAAAQVGDGGRAISASGSVLAPIPVAGPEFRYFLTDSPRVFVQGSVYGMYLFGYGNFISAGGNLGVNVAKHLSILAGYQLASHLQVQDANSRIGFRLTEKGANVGIEASF